jgi:hypothetical protein
MRLIPVVFKNTEQAQYIIAKLNKIVGFGKKNWTIRQPVMRHLHEKKPVTTNIEIIREITDAEVLLIEQEIMSATLCH